MAATDGAATVNAEVKMERSTGHLGRLIADGQVWMSAKLHAFIGRASDGQEVFLGDLDDVGGTEAYLASHPNPEDW